jgi:hypothetical protein
MGDTQANAYQPTAAADVVAVFDANFNQLFSDARPLKATVTETAKLMKHPIESGSTISDFRVIDPIKISLHMILTPATYVSTYQQIRQVFFGNSTIQVQTNTQLYSNMMIETMPHDEAAEFFDTIKLTLTLEEVLIVSSSTSPLPASMTTANGGNVNGAAPSATTENEANKKSAGSSAAYSLFFGGSK